MTKITRSRPLQALFKTDATAATTAPSKSSVRNSSNNALPLYQQEGTKKRRVKHLFPKKTDSSQNPTLECIHIMSTSSMMEYDNKQMSPPASPADKNGSSGGVIFLLKATFDDPIAERPRPTRFNMKSTRTVGEVATWVRKNIGPTMWNKWDVVLVGIIDYDQWDDRQATIEVSESIYFIFSPLTCHVSAR
jgi:hypothetical protein